MNQQGSIKVTFEVVESDVDYIIIGCFWGLVFTMANNIVNTMKGGNLGT